MAATNSLPTFGMHHCCFRHRLISFFQPQADRLVGQGLHQSQLHHLARQGAHGPVVMAIRGRAAGQGYEVGFYPFIHLPVPVDLVMVPQHLIQSFLSIPSLGAEHGSLRHVQGSGHLRSGPALIYLEQGCGPV